MATPQSAILPEGSSHALFLTLALADGEESATAARAALAEFPARTRALGGRLDQRMGDVELVSAVGISARVWDRIAPSSRPAELAGFPAHDGAPATPGDLFVHIRAEGPDACFELGRDLLARLGDAVTVIEEVAGFRYLENRDLTGFVDGTENPEGDERAEVALIGTEDEAFAGGTYMSTQRYVHDLARWEALHVGDQEKVIGRTKEHDLELDDDVKPADAHIARVVIEEDGEELEILRHSMPYGTPSEAGLVFLAYGRTPSIFDRMLARMMGVGPEAEGQRDRLMDFSSAVTGGRFFAPSVEFLEAL